jgi:hypothetical protein
LVLLLLFFLVESNIQILDRAVLYQLGTKEHLAPSYYKDSQRQAKKDACQIASVEVLSIINEITVASLAYVFDKKHNERILFFDMVGGGVT